MILLLQEGAKNANNYPSGQGAINNEIYFDRQTYIQVIKTIKGLANITPYNLMREGIAGFITAALIENLNTLEKMNNRDQLLRNEIF